MNFINKTLCTTALTCALIPSYSYGYYNGENFNNFSYNQGIVQGITSIKTGADTQILNISENNFATKLQRIVTPLPTTTIPVLVTLPDHATGLVIRRLDGNNLVFIYNDPYGYDLPKTLKDAIQGIPNSTLLNLKARIQNDNTNCGPLTIKTLEQIYNHGQLTSIEELRTLVSAIDVTELRKQDLLALVNAPDTAKNRQTKAFYDEYQKIQAALGEKEGDYNMADLEEALKNAKLLIQPVREQAAINRALSEAEKASILAKREKATQEDLSKALSALTPAIPAQSREVSPTTIASDLDKGIAALEQAAAIPSTDSATIQKTEELEDAVVASLALQANNAKTAKEMPAMFSDDQASSEAMSMSSKAATDANRVRIAPAYTAVASGDESPIRRGAWVKGSLTRAEQKEHDKISAYNLSQTAASIGFDIGEDYVLGASYTLVNSEIKGKRFNKKDDVSTHIGSIYGSANFDNNIVTTGQIYYGISNIKKKRDASAKSKSVVTAKTKGKLFGGNVALGYNFRPEATNISILPMVGISYDKVTINAYSEKGAILARKKTDKRTESKAEGFAKLTLASSHKMDDAKTLTGEVHGQFNYLFTHKDSGAKGMLTKNQAFALKAPKAAKNSFGFGGSLTLNSNDQFEFALGYDYGMARKFHSHTGSLSAKVNF